MVWHNRVQVVVWLVLAVVLPAQAVESYSGKIVDVVDGATVVVKSAAGEVVSNRLWGLVAPWPDQPYGLGARDHLAVVAVGREVNVTDSVRGADGLTHGYVWFPRVDTSLNDQVLKEGGAWCEHLSGDEADAFLLEASKEGKQNRLGLWALQNPIHPREWVKAHPASTNAGFRSYASFDEAVANLLPTVKSKRPKDTNWLMYSEARSDTANGYVVALPCGDFRVENAFAYRGLDSDGKSILMQGVLVSVAIQISYAKKGSEPTEAACQDAVEKYFTRGSEIRKEIGRAGNTVSCKQSLLARFGAAEAMPSYAYSNLGRLFVLLKNCRREKVDASYGPASLQGSSKKDRQRVLSIGHRRNDDVHRQTYRSGSY